MIRFMLDTNICIYIIKKKPVQVLERLKNCLISEIGISSITLGELEYGAAKSSRPDRNRMACSSFWLPSKSSTSMTRRPNTTVTFARLWNAGNAHRIHGHAHCGPCTFPRWHTGHQQRTQVRRVPILETGKLGPVVLRNMAGRPLKYRDLRISYPRELSPHPERIEAFGASQRFIVRVIEKRAICRPEAGFDPLNKFN